MSSSSSHEVKQVAAQLLAGMLANPHIYASVSDEGALGRQEQELVTIALDLAESLLTKAEERQPSGNLHS